MKDIIHFAHGNGFPSPCYRQFFNYLSPRYECVYIDRVGHNPNFPVGENWHNLAQELVDSIKEKAQQPVIGIGHSLGGILNFLASVENPELFKAVILLDSPLLNPIKSNVVRFAKKMGYIDSITPAHRTKTRRMHWSTIEELVEYLKERPLFATFDEQCLQDYIDYGLEKTDLGYSLRFDRSIEYLIYRTIPHMLPQYEGKIKTPTALIYGAQTRVVDAMDRYYMKKYFKISSYPTKGTHLFPLEYPQVAANTVMEVLDSLVGRE